MCLMSRLLAYTPRDNQRLLDTLTHLKSLGNTVIVVEHDEATMLHADELIDMGPAAGLNGGHIIAQGTPQAIIEHPDSLTGAYLSHRQSIPTPQTRCV